MSFQSPIYAWLFLLLPLLLALDWYGAARRQIALRRFLGTAAPGFVPLPGRRAWRLGLMLLASAAMVLALMRPQWGTAAQSVQRSGRDLVVMLDVSQSMLARDVAPDRLGRAKAAVARLIGSLDPAAGHRFKLFAFAGRTALLSPFTDDHGLFLDRLDGAGPASVLRHGTRIGDALRLALQDLDAREGAFTDVIVLSDGEDHGGMAGDAARTAAARNITVHAVGIGDAREGAPLPVPGEDGASTLLQHDGAPVRSRLQAGPLRQLAERTGGVYLEAGTGTIDLGPLFAEQIASKPARLREGAAEQLPVERFQWFVVVAMLAWAAALLPRRADGG